MASGVPGREVDPNLAEFPKSCPRTSLEDHGKWSSWARGGSESGRVSEIVPQDVAGRPWQVEFLGARWIRIWQSFRNRAPGRRWKTMASGVPGREVDPNLAEFP